MYSYLNSSAKKRHESFVPQRAATSQLVDNRPESIIQRKLQTTMDTTKVIQLGIAKKKKKKPVKKKKVKIKDVFERPNFTTDSKKSAVLHHNSNRKSTFKIDIDKPNLPSLNAAQPHRFPWKDIREVVKQYHNGGGDKEFLKLVKFFKRSGEKRIRSIDRRLSHSKKKKDLRKIAIREELLKRAKGSQKSFNDAHDSYINSKNDSTLKEFLRQANSHHANVPDYGPHQGVNNPVSDAVHLNLRPSRSRKRKRANDPHPRSPSPTSRRLLKGLLPSMSEKGIAFTTDGKIITTSGDAVDVSALRPEVRRRVRRFKKTTIKGYIDDAPFGSPYKKKG